MPERRVPDVSHSCFFVLMLTTEDVPVGFTQSAQPVKPQFGFERSGWIAGEVAANFNEHTSKLNSGADSYAAFR